VLSIAYDEGTVEPPVSPTVSGGAIGYAGTPSNTGCGVASLIQPDNYGNRVSANKHWCWSYGAVYDQYGWGDYGTCSFFCSFAGWHYNFGFDRGWKNKGEFHDVSIGIASITSTASACIYVYGNGTATGC
jgi:hypothetical protein